MTLGRPPAPAREGFLGRTRHLPRQERAKPKSNRVEGKLKKSAGSAAILVPILSPTYATSEFLRKRMGMVPRQSTTRVDRRQSNCLSSLPRLLARDRARTTGAGCGGYSPRARGSKPRGGRPGSEVGERPADGEALSPDRLSRRIRTRDSAQGARRTKPHGFPRRARSALCLHGPRDNSNPSGQGETRHPFCRWTGKPTAFGRYPRLARVLPVFNSCL